MHCEACVALRIRTVKNVTLSVCPVASSCCRHSLCVLSVLYVYVCVCVCKCVFACPVCMKRPKIAFVCKATRSCLLGAQQRAAGSGSQFALATHYSSLAHTYTQRGTHTHTYTFRNTRIHVAREREILIASLVVGLVCVL